MIRIALDFIVAGLLGATIFYAVVLSRRLEQLRADGAALQAVVMGFQEVASRAEAGVERLKALAGDGSAELRQRISAAEELKADIAALVERGESLADRLMVSTRPTPQPAVAQPDATGIGEEAARNLLRALRKAR